MTLTTTQILQGIMLLGCIAHMMIYFNGYWNEALWMSALLVVVVPIVFYKYVSKPKKMKRSDRMSREI